MKKENTINYENVVSRFRDIHNVRAICVVGSLTRPYVTQPGDVDLLMVSEDLTQDTLFNMLASTYPHNKIIASDDAFRIMSNVPFSIANIDRNKFEARLNSLLNGTDVDATYKPWAILGNAPEVLVADVVDGKVLFEKNNYFSQIKSQFNVYPQEMRAAILEYVGNEIANLIILANKALLADDQMLAKFIVHHSLFPLLRGLFSNEMQFFRGMKYLLPQLKMYLPDKLELLSNTFIFPHQNLRESIDAISDIASNLR